MGGFKQSGIEIYRKQYDIMTNEYKHETSEELLYNTDYIVYGTVKSVQMMGCQKTYTNYIPVHVFEIEVEKVFNGELIPDKPVYIHISLGKSLDICGFMPEDFSKCYVKLL